MKKRSFLLVGMAVIITVIITFTLKQTMEPKGGSTKPQEHHYVLLQSDGSLKKGEYPLDFKKIEWKSVGRGDVYIPRLEGQPILCKLGDEQGAMYSYHPFEDSDRNDFKHNVATLPANEIGRFLPEFTLVASEATNYQSIIKVERHLGGLDSPRRKVIEGTMSLHEYVEVMSGN